jgi:signal transduction histidine kinase
MFVNLMVALGMVFLAAYPPLLRMAPTPRGRYWRDIAAGTVMAVFCLLYPWRVAEGQQMDLRMVPMALVGWMYGWPAALPIGLIALAVRTAMGGPGIITTPFYTLGCLALIPFFQRRPRTLVNLALMGVGQALVGYVVGITLAYPQAPGLGPTGPFWLLIAAVNVIGIWLVNGAVMHVNERQRLQMTLTDALRSKEAVLGVIPHGILILDARGQVTESNQAAQALLHTQALAQVLASPDVASALKAQRRISSCRLTLSYDGAERIVLVSAVPLAAGGAVLGIENVTTVIRQEREEARRDRLELLGRMAAMAAHEIRNPLTTVRGFLQLLARRPEFNAHRSTFTLVQAEVEHINRVVGDFLDLSGAQQPNPEPILLDAVLGDVLSGISLQFPESPVTMDLEGDPGLVALADRKSLKQILRNLVANAFEAMPAGGQVTIRRHAAADAIIVEVTDNGPGIAPDVLAHIFTPYMTTKTTGTGLGLAISHKLASDMGGLLAVTSDMGQGSTFRLELPAAAGLAQAAAASQPE